jgi:hypothetical protein
MESPHRHPLGGLTRVIWLQVATRTAGKWGAPVIDHFGIDVSVNRVHHVAAIGDVQLYLGWLVGDSEYLQR